MTLPPPTLSPWGQFPATVPWSPTDDIWNRPRVTMIPSCQAIVFYHTCGCKSNEPPVYFCNTSSCQHETSTLLTAGLPFACNSLPARTEACRVEDRAKTEFVREVDTADRLQSLNVQPGCPKGHIDALPLYVRSELQTWDEGICSRQPEKVPRTSGMLPRETLHGTLGGDLDKIDIEEITKRLQRQFEGRAKERPSEDENNEEVGDEQAVQEKGGSTEDIQADGEAPVKSQPLEVSHEVGSSGSSSAGGDDENNYQEPKNSRSDSEGNIGKGIEEDGKGALNKPEVSDAVLQEIDAVAKNMDNIHLGGENQDKGEDMSSGGGKAKASSHANTLDETNQVTDDFIDFLLSTEDYKPVEKKTAMGRVLSYFRGT